MLLIKRFRRNLSRRSSTTVVRKHCRDLCKNMSGTTEEPAKVYEDYKEMHKELMKQSV